MSLETADKLALMGTVLTLIGLVVAVGAIYITVKQLIRSNEIAKVQSWLTLRGLFSNYDDIHVNLRLSGKWCAPPDAVATGPVTGEEWAKVEGYLGLFGYCNELIESGLLDKEQTGSLRASGSS